MTTWLPPHISKIYEALTAIADNRIKLVSKNEASVTKGIDTQNITSKIAPIFTEACSLKLNYLGKKIVPTNTY